MWHISAHTQQNLARGLCIKHSCSKCFSDDATVDPFTLMLINCYLIKIEVSAHYALQWFLSFVLSFVVACIFFSTSKKSYPVVVFVYSKWSTSKDFKRSLQPVKRKRYNEMYLHQRKESTTACGNKKKLQLQKVYLEMLLCKREVSSRVLIQWTD